MKRVNQRQLEYKDRLHIRWMGNDRTRNLHFTNIEDKTKCTIHVLTATPPKTASQTPAVAAAGPVKRSGPEPMDWDYTSGSGSTPSIATNAFATHYYCGVHLMVSACTA